MTLPIQIDLPAGDRSRQQSMFDTGYGFHEAALRCADEVKNPDGSICAPTAPMIACMAFAAELYLKSFILTSGREPPKKHRLNVLWAMLPPSVRTEVAAEFQLKIDLSEEKMASELQRLGAAFVEWRYIFDARGQQISVSILAIFAKSLFKVIKRRHPDWDVTPYLAGRIEDDQRAYPLHIICGAGGVVGIIQSAPKL